MRVTYIFITLFFKVKRNYLNFNLLNFLFDAQIRMLHCTVFLHRLTEIGKFPEDFIPLKEIQNFDTPDRQLS